MYGAGAGIGQSLASQATLHVSDGKSPTSYTGIARGAGIKKQSQSIMNSFAGQGPDPSNKQIVRTTSRGGPMQFPDKVSY